MPSLEAPVHPFHLTVGNCPANQHQFLVTDGWKFFGNPLHRAVNFLQAPAHPVVLRAAEGDVALIPPQAGQLLKALLQRAVADPIPIAAGLVLRLLVQQGSHGFLRQAGAHGVEKPQGEALAAIGELIPPLVGQAPAIAWPAWAGDAGARFGQASLGQAFQLSSNRLDRQVQGSGQVSGVGIPALQQQGQQSVASAGLNWGGHGAPNLVPRCHRNGRPGVHNGASPWADLLP